MALPNKRKKKKSACWAGYVKKGVKKKGNKTVNNCVRKKTR
jgi:hypothetical protein|tara:strand:+ start:861 stop:983 length:123 start_codon:yes stop_codon:yes gene_type:complete